MTTKTNYKSKNGDKFLTYTLIGFAVAFFAIILSLILFKIFDKTLKYDSFDALPRQSALLTQSEDQYLVYYYTESCHYCQEIKTEVLNFANENNANIKVYFWDGAVLGTAPYTEIEGTPAMIMVSNGRVVDIINGYIQIPATFDLINAGTYSYIN